MKLQDMRVYKQMELTKIGEKWTTKLSSVMSVILQQLLKWDLISEAQESLEI